MTDRSAHPIVLLTDFGLGDWFVGVMKGTIAARCPSAVMIDLTHDIAPGDIEQAAFVLSVAHKEFPPETVFLCVVDPGVGSDRDAVAIRHLDRWYVGPNNGLFTAIVSADEGAAQCWRLTSQKPPRSSTFHGRDVFAPAAAHLACGNAIAELADGLCVPVRLRTQLTTVGPDGSIRYIDRFGNAITSIVTDSSRAHSGVVRLEGSETEFPMLRTFSDAQTGQPLSYVGSCGLIELGVRDGNARDKYGLKVGQKVRWIL